MVRGGIIAALFLCIGAIPAHSSQINASPAPFENSSPAPRAVEPVEVLELPMPRHVAIEWCWQHFEDLGAERIGELVARLTRPTGPLV